MTFLAVHRRSGKRYGEQLYVSEEGRVLISSPSIPLAASPSRTAREFGSRRRPTARGSRTGRQAPGRTDASAQSYCSEGKCLKAPGPK